MKIASSQWEVINGSSYPDSTIFRRESQWQGKDSFAWQQWSTQQIDAPSYSLPVMNLLNGKDITMKTFFLSQVCTFSNFNHAGINKGDFFLSAVFFPVKSLLFFFIFLLLCFLPWELYPLDPQIFYVLFQILYIRFTPYTFSLFNLIMA